jgi:hypothetical protein
MPYRRAARGAIRPVHVLKRENDMSATPIEIHGQGLTYPQFLEDCYAAAASRRKAGSATIQTETGAELFQGRP